MARYFLHLRDGHDQLLDPEGINYPSLDAVKATVLAAARGMIAADAQEGLINLNYRIDAEDELGEVVHTLPFDRAVTILRPAS